MVDLERIRAVEELEPFDDEYVYDLVMEDSSVPYFFANGILVHNSVYFSMEKLVSDVESGVACADAIVDVINESFPPFMSRTFNCQPGFDTLIKANREIVASAGIFRAKKKYVMLGVDMEGKRLDPTDPKSLKTQGSDIKISSTPESIRQMLKDVTMMVLQGVDKTRIDDYILKFRRDFINIQHDNVEQLNILDYAAVNSVKTLDKAMLEYERIEKPGLGKARIAAATRAVINHNEFIKAAGITDEPEIRNGQKVKVLWLQENDHGYEYMGFPSELDELPDWFYQHFKVNLKTTEAKLIDHKLELIFDPIGWTVPTEQTVKVGKLLSFD